MQKSITAAFMNAALSQGKRSTRTRIERHRVFVRLEAYAKEQRFHQVTPQNMTLKQVKMFLDSMRATASPRTLQNVMSHMRAALRGAGRANVTDSPEWGNKSLNLESKPGDRTGKHRALTEGELQAAQEKATKMGAVGREFLVLSELQRTLGLRIQEAVQSGDSLKAWQAALTTGHPVLVSKGAKGGRSRMTVIPQSLLERATRAVDNALVLSQQNEGKMVQSASLKSALDRYSNACRSVGLAGDASNHALRVTFAHDSYRAYVAQGYDQQGALSRVSQDLGHGSGRGRYAKGVYLRGLFE
jgi:hypothetical protein